MLSTIRRQTAAAAVALMLTGPAFAAPDCEPKDPGDVARATVQTLLEELNSRRAELRQNPEQLYALIERVLVPKIDVDYMAQLVLGRHARAATPEQMQRFTAAFKQMVIQTYGNALYGFDDEKVEFLPVRAPEGAEDITFQAVVTTDRGDEIPVNLDLHLVDCQWKIYNGSIGNLSFVTTYRGQFNAQIQAAGIETLIQKMEQRYAGGVTDPAQ